MRFVLLVPGWTIAVLLSVWAQTVLAEVIVDLRHLEDTQFEQEFFRLERGMQLHIECEGAGERHDPSLFAYGWLLQSETRQVPWVLDWDSSSSRGQNRRFDDLIELPPGDYVATFGAFWTGRSRSVRVFDREIFRILGGKNHVSSKDMRRWKLVISTVNESDTPHGAALLLRMISSRTPLRRISSRVVFAPPSRLRSS
jgi:hypothetical protein